MTVRLITFSDENMDTSAQHCAESAMENGADKAVAAWWEYVKQNYYTDTALASAPRGPAFWSWKPLVVQIGMEDLSDDDFLIYSDAGVEFINDVQIIIDRMDQDIFLFGNQWEHAHWCKRDIIDAIWPHPCPGCNYHHNETWERFGKQVQASVTFFRVSDYTRKFVKEWLDWCLFEGGRLIDDSPSRTPNHPEFQENRHDQAILTTMAYRDGIKLHWWPAVYGPGRHPYPKNEFTDDYPPIFLHHRRRNHEWEQVA